MDVSTVRKWVTENVVNNKDLVTIAVTGLCGLAYAKWLSWQISTPVYVGIGLTAVVLWLMWTRRKRADAENEKLREKLDNVASAVANQAKEHGEGLAELQRVVRSVTELKDEDRIAEERRQSAIQKAFESLTAIDEVSLALGADASDQAIRDGCARVASHASGALGAFALGEVVTCVKGVSKAKNVYSIVRLGISPPQSGGGIVPLHGSVPLEKLVREPELPYFFEAEADQKYLTLHVPFKVRTLLVLRIVDPLGEFLGFLWISSDKANAFDPRFVIPYARLVAQRLAPIMGIYLSDRTAVAGRAPISKPLENNG